MIVVTHCLLMVFFFSSRRRHTRCALVMEFRRVLFRSPRESGPFRCTQPRAASCRRNADPIPRCRRRPRANVGAEASRLSPTPSGHQRRDEIGRASVGKECVSTCRSRWSPYHYKKKKINYTRRRLKKVKIKKKTKT